MKKLICVVAVALALVGCDSAEVKAAKQFAAAKELIAQGDLPRAIVELRNALKNDATLVEARLLFAELLQKRGRKADAFNQYRLVLESDPQNLAAARAMAMIAFDAMAWTDAEKYAATGLALAPADPELQAVQTGVDYRKAAKDRNPDEMERAASRAARLLAQDPALERARRIVLSDMIRRNDLVAALTTVDDGLKLQPEDRDFNNVRLVVLTRLNNKPEVEKQILAMIALYPDDPEIGRVLVEFYLSNGRADQAEAWLRGRITPEGTDPGPRKALLGFLGQARSKVVMRDELAHVLAQTPLPPDVAAHEIEFSMIKSAADYELGDRQQAMTALESLLEGAEPSEQIDEVKVQLAQMRLGEGNPVGARALVEEVLAHDPGQNGAIKLKSAWLIDEDKTQDAVRLLRDGLADAPEDSQLMILLAGAYDREGRPELVADMLARAVEVSRQGPVESLRYASYLLQKGEASGAETVLIDALRRRPDTMELLVLLTRVHLEMKDWPRAGQDIATIRERFRTPQATAMANELQAQLLKAQGDAAGLDSFLNDLAQQSPMALQPRVSVVRNMIATQRFDAALQAAQALAREVPSAPEPQLLLAHVHLSMGQTAEAISILQALVAAHPAFAPGWKALYTVQQHAGDMAGAKTTAEAAAKAFPDSSELQVIQAGELERAGDIEGAIAIYERLYSRNSSDLIVANNLASLLAATRQDQDSLDKAWAVARRLNGSNVPAFQDTYGWIAFRRGDLTTALAALEPAARGLPDDPSVAYHLAQTYAALGRKDEARAEYQRGVTLIDTGAKAYPGLSEQITAGLAALGAP